MKHIKLLILLLFIVVAQAGYATLANKVSIVCLNDDTTNTDAYVYSVKQMLDVSGVPYEQAASLDAALVNRMLVLAGSPDEISFSEAQVTLLVNYIKNGGIIVSSAIEDEDSLALFGVSSPVMQKDRFQLKWDTNAASQELKWCDDEREQTISLGSSDKDETIKSWSYSLNGAAAIASYDDGSAAATKFTLGKGSTYLVGTPWKSVIALPLCNKDSDAQRDYSNSFEPSADVFCLFIRGIFSTNQTVSLWKHTSPGHSKSSLIITHDCDSTSSYDTLNEFVDYEVANNLPAHYFITTRYFSDYLMGPFYNSESIPKLKYILANGLTVGSHSVGHFPDMKDDDVFPEGDKNVDQSSYLPSYSEESGTSGGTIWGECKVSKELLEKDLGVKIDTWRSGHLCFPKKLTNVLEEAGYRYNSSMSSNNILHNFPYFEKQDRKTSGKVSTVLEIPMTLSDVFMDNPIDENNYQEKAEIWKTVFKQYANNYSSCVLLIHPNRSWKVTAQKMLVDGLPDGAIVYDFKKYGEFWKNRLLLDFDYSYDNGSLSIVIKDAELMKTNELGIVLEHNGNSVNVSLTDINGTAYNFSRTVLDTNRDVLQITDNVADSATLTMAVQPENGGTTVPAAGKSSIVKGENYLIVADPAEGYQFKEWLVSENVEIADKQTETTVVSISDDGMVTAVFELSPSAGEQGVLVYNQMISSIACEGKSKQTGLILVAYDIDNEKFGNAAEIVIDKKNKHFQIDTNCDLNCMKNEKCMLIKSSDNNKWHYMVCSQKVIPVDIGFGKDNPAKLATSLFGIKSYFSDLDNWSMANKVTLKFNKKLTLELKNADASSIVTAIEYLKTILQKKNLQEIE